MLIAENIYLFIALILLQKFGIFKGHSGLFTKLLLKIF